MGLHLCVQKNMLSAAATVSLTPLNNSVCFLSLAEAALLRPTNQEREKQLCVHAGPAKTSRCLKSTRVSNTKHLRSSHTVVAPWGSVSVLNSQTQDSASPSSSVRSCPPVPKSQLSTRSPTAGFTAQLVTKKRKSPEVVILILQLQ
jgi:hypothetical protein